MRANGGVPVIAISLLVLAVGCGSPRSALAEGDCLAAPNGEPPHGSRWFYQTDRIKQRRCWHLRQRDDAAKTATSASAAASEGAPDNRETPQPQSASANPPSLRGSLAQKAIQDSEVRQPTVVPDPPPRPTAPLPPPSDDFAWPDVPPPLYTGALRTPDISSPAAGSSQRSVSEKTPEKSETQKRELPASATNSGKDADDDFTADGRHLTEAAASHNQIPFGVLVAFAAGLAIAGVFVWQIAKTALGQGGKVYVEQQEARVALEGITRRSIPRSPATDPLDSVQDDAGNRALRKLLLVLEQQTV